MPKLNDPAAAQAALLAMYAEDMFDPAQNTLTPRLDPRAAGAWQIVGYITAENALFDTQAIGLGERVYFGFLARSINAPNAYVAVIRGTESTVEWLENLEGLLVPHPAGGLVEQGFYSIYKSMRYSPLPPDGALTVAAAAAGQDAAAGIGQAVPAAATVSVIGHSLGAVLATFLMLDLARVGAQKYAVNATLIASPRAGDKDFVSQVDHAVPNYQVYNYIWDIVPHVPPSLPLGLGFQSLPKASWIKSADAQAKIKNEPHCNHHAFCYAAMLDYTSVQGVINGYVKCILRKN